MRQKPKPTPKPKKKTRTAKKPPALALGDIVTYQSPTTGSDLPAVILRTPYGNDSADLVVFGRNSEAATIQYGTPFSQIATPGCWTPKPPTTTKK